VRPGFCLSVILLLFLLFFMPGYGIKVICSFILLIQGVSYVVSMCTRLTLKIEREETILRGYRYQILEIKLKVTNRGFLPVISCFVTDRPGNLFCVDKNRFLISLRAGEEKYISYRIECRERGEFVTGPAILQGNDPLGLFPWKLDLCQITRVIIYPAVHDLSILIKEGLPSGNLLIDNPIYEDVTRYRSMREYVPGDDLRRINWKLSARMGTLYCREFLPSYYFPSLVILNLQEAAYPHKHRYYWMERAIETATSLIFYCLQKDQMVGFASSGVDCNGEPSPVYPIKGGYTHGMSLLETLARINPSESSLSHSSLASINTPTGCRIMYVGPLLSEEELKLFISYWGGTTGIDFFFATEKRITGTGRIRRFSIIEHGRELIHG
jgi:uncharacterized protein (DUF58 family)